MTRPIHDPDSAAPPAPAEEHTSRTFWICLAIGWVAIGIGLFGIADHPSDANPVKVFRLLVGLNITNDAIVVPIVLLAGFLARRWAPCWLLAPAQVWLIVSGVVTLYAYPLVGHFGGDPGNHSELPHDYAHNLLIVLAVITVFCGALAIASWRRDPCQASVNQQEAAAPPGRSVTALRVVIVAVSVVPTLAYVGVALRRVGYPFELEWLEGGAVEIVRRVAHGQSIYTAPTIHYAPYPYPPLYFWTAGALAHITGVSFLPLRIVSLVSSLGAIGMIVRIVWSESGDAVAGIVAAGLFTATFAVSGAWFDIGRVDSLALLLVLIAVSAARRATTTRHGVLVGLLIFVAFMAKQSALVAAAPIVVLLIVTRRRVGAAALVTAAGLVAGSTVVLNATTHGWYGYYVFQELTHQGTETSVWVTFFTVDLRHVAMTVCLGLLGLVVHLKHRPAPSTDWLFWTAATGGLVLSAFVSRLHSGGGADVLMPAFAAVALLGGLGYDALRRAATSRLPLRLQPGSPWANTAVAAALAVVVSVQLATLHYNPRQYIPTAADQAAGNTLIALLRQAPGPVIVTDHPHYATMAGKAPSAQGEAVHDILRAGPSRARTQLVASIDTFVRSSEEATIFSDEPDAAFEGAAEGSFELTQAHVFTCETCFYPVTDLKRRPDYIFQRQSRTTGP